MLHVHRSDRTEVLVDRLASLLHDDPQPDPMRVEPVVVGSAGMARWLEGRLATASPHGVLAGVTTVFPGTFVASLAADVLGDPGPRPDPWSPPLLTWGVAELLPDLLAAAPPGGDDPWARVRRYVAADVPHAEVGRLPVTRRLLQVAGDAAARFDRYALHRPEMLAAWREGDDVDPAGVDLGEHRWQALLWRAVADQLPVASPAGRVADAVELLRSGRQVPGLPPRLAVFGLSSLPRLHLRLLAELARERPVHLFVPSPADAAWAAGRTHDDTPPAAPLLRAAGPVARDAGRLVADAAAAAGVELDDVHVAAPDGGPAPASVLGRLRATVVDDRGPQEHARSVPGDDTVALHACRGQLRQVEVLRDELRRRFDADPTLQPRDVVVLTPDLASFGPLAQAVLAAEPDRADAPPALPVAVADRAPGVGNQVATTLLRAVRLVRGRATAAAVLDLLTAAPVLRRHGIDPADVGTLERWVEAVGVVWARDAADRAAAGQPPSDEATWRRGLDRLLLGVALPGLDDRLLAGLAPYPHVEDGADLDLLERLVVLLDVVDRLATLRTPRGAGDWHAQLGALLDELTGPADGWPSLDDTTRGTHRRERAAVDAALAELSAPAGFTGRDVTVDAVLPWLERALAAPGGGAAGFATGAVTVAGLVPLRAVPFRVVCLLGMDEGGFPRVTRRSSDDLLAAARRPGDDDPRAEDRHAFVEALLAARDALVVTWTGFDPRRGDERQPAGPVVDLLDELDLLVEGGAEVLTTQHPVLPTSPLAFEEGRGPSYDHDRHAAAVVALEPALEVPPFVPRPLAGEPDVTMIALDDLVRDAAAPQAALLSALQVAQRDDLSVLPSVEAVEPSGLDRYAVGARLLERLLDGQDRAGAETALLASGGLPAGTPGRLLLAEVGPEAERIARAGLARQPRRGVPVLADVRGSTVAGDVRAVDLDDGLVVPDVGFGRVTNRAVVQAWLRHLVACAGQPAPVTTVLVRRSGGDEPHVAVLHPRDSGDAVDQLQPWVAQHADLRRTAVAFHPEVSWTWAEAVHAGRGEAWADRKAREAWEPLEDEVWWGGRVAWDDPAVRLVFRAASRWARLRETTDVTDRAERLLVPLLVALEEGAAAAASVAADAAGVGA